MPESYIHMSCMRLAATKLATKGYSPPNTDLVNPHWKGMEPRVLGQIMLDHVNFANLGAVGPDLLFFLPDFAT